MKQAQAIDMWNKGHRLLPVEFRSSRLDHIQWRDKTSGKSLDAHILKHTVEAGNDSISVTERTPDGFSPEQWGGPKFKKGERVILQFDALEIERGLISARGTLLPLES